MLDIEYPFSGFFAKSPEKTMCVGKDFAFGYDVTDFDTASPRLYPNLWRDCAEKENLGHCQKNGLWTKKLGFVEWKDAKTRVIKTKLWLYRETLLEIYLKKAFFEETSRPDEILDLTHIEDKEHIETIMNNLIDKQHEIEN